MPPSNSILCADEEVAQVHDNAAVADRTFHYFLSTYSAVSYESFGHDDSTSICHFDCDLNAALRNVDSLYDCVVFAFVWENHRYLLMSRL